MPNILLWVAESHLSSYSIGITGTTYGAGYSGRLSDHGSTGEMHDAELISGWQKVTFLSKLAGGSLCFDLGGGGGGMSHWGLARTSSA